MCETGPVIIVIGMHNTTAVNNGLAPSLPHVMWYLTLASPFGLVSPSETDRVDVSDSSDYLVKATPEIYAVAGGRTFMPCNITIPTTEDDITLIMWYKGETKVPIYSLDARKGPLKNARHFPSSELGARAYFNVSTAQPSLNIDPVHAEDEGVYKCRIEYRRSRTVSHSLRLNVIVPPQEVIIMDEYGQRLRDVIGPYDEGTFLWLVCEAEGGIPSPVVTWWRDSVLLDETYSIKTQGFVRNELALPHLQRSDLMAVFTCQASNTNLSVPTSSSVTLDLNLKPLDVRITTLQRPLSSGLSIQLECESTGSRPRALLTWWKDDKKIQTGKETASDNLTVSTLNFVPKAEDNGKVLSCRAQNPSLTGSTIEDGWTLIVHYPPELSLALGTNINQNAIKEGSDVYFECTINSNPWVTEVGWRFEGRPLFSNTSVGIIVSNQSLVLQKVLREHRGVYQCIAVNMEGEGRSEGVFLKVKYAPVCKEAQNYVYGVARYEAVNVSCEVEADPSDVNFRWTLNNSVENVDIRSFVSNGTKSIVTYTPKTMLGYGALLCWGRNSIGSQRDPCVFRIIPAGPPESVRSCLVSNQTTSSLIVECEAGYDGGMTQRFHLEVYNSAVEHLQVNLTASEDPIFSVLGLPAGTSFILVLYAANAKGRSNSVALMASTLSPAERQRADQESAAVSPILGVLIGLVAVLVLIAVVIIIVMRRQGRDIEKGSALPHNVTKCDMPLKKDTDDIQDSVVESPDIIPTTNDTQQAYTGIGDQQEKGGGGGGETTYEFSNPSEKSFEYLTTNRRQKNPKRNNEIMYAELSHPDVQLPYVARRFEPPTDYAELDFQRRLGIQYQWPLENTEDVSSKLGDVPMVNKSTDKNRDRRTATDARSATTPL